MFDIHAMRDAVIFKVREMEDETTSGGIILTANSINKNDHHGVFGEVLAVGSEVKGCAVGDTILVNKFDAVPFPYKTEIMHFTKIEYIRGRLVG